MVLLWALRFINIKPVPKPVLSTFWPNVTTQTKTTRRNDTAATLYTQNPAIPAMLSLLVRPFVENIFRICRSYDWNLKVNSFWNRNNSRSKFEIEQSWDSPKSRNLPFRYACNGIRYLVLNRTTCVTKSVLRYDLDKDLILVWNSVFTQSCFPNKKADKQRRVK